jgi:hypothetical protein
VMKLEIFLTSPSATQLLMLAALLVLCRILDILVRATKDRNWVFFRGHSAPWN